jgi:hypothetical protein
MDCPPVAAGGDTQRRRVFYWYRKGKAAVCGRTSLSALPGPLVQILTLPVDPHPPLTCSDSSLPLG